jgi:CHAD domain-containing protein
MDSVLEEIDEVGDSFLPDPVHDLRVALRRCRSMAGGIMAIDCDKTWRAMRKECGDLFKSLGALRDIQVLSVWALRIGGPEDPATVAMLAWLDQRELESKKEAAESIRFFDREKWLGWTGRLQARTRRLPPAGAAFQLIALRRWVEAHELHRQAMRNQSMPSYHRLRIGLKKFRYTVENFLPALHAEWGDDLRDIQNWLGELHDLSVLWETAARIGAFPDADCRKRWRAIIDQERENRIVQYRAKMAGGHSLWSVWRAGLPGPTRLRALSLNVMEKWGSFNGINLGRARCVRRLALQLFDGLRSRQALEPHEFKSQRALLHAAAILDEARSSRGRKVEKAAGRLLEQTSLLQGFTPESLELLAILLTCLRRKFYVGDAPAFDNLEENRRRPVAELAGILRLARVLGRDRDCSIQSLRAQCLRDSIVVFAEGYSEFSPLAEKVARARHTLEWACRMPVLVRSAPANPALTVPQSSSAF